MEVKFREKFEKDIEKIKNQKTLDNIIKVIENIENAQKPQDILNLKKMKGSKTAFRVRIGKFRIGIYINGNIVEFTRVLSRDRIYKYFPD